MMTKIFSVELGILTAIGGFVDIGDLVTNTVVGSRVRFGTRLGGRRRRRSVSACTPNMAGRVAAVSGRATFEIIRERLGPRDRGRRPGRVVLHQPDDADRRDRRCGVGASVGHRRRSDDVDTGRGVRGVGSGLAGEVLDHGECHRHAWPDARSCSRSRCSCTASELGRPRSTSVTAPAHSRRRVCRRHIGTLPSRCSAPR